MLRTFIAILFVAPVLVSVQTRTAEGFEFIKPGPESIQMAMGAKKTDIESIKLERRNWESHGTDVTINKEGDFEVTAVFLGETKKIREGTLTRKQMGDLVRLIEKSRYYESQDEYKGPFKTEFSWWGYQLTVKTKQRIKSVRFHSEDDTVPEKLKGFVGLIMESTK